MQSILPRSHSQLSAESCPGFANSNPRERGDSPIICLPLPYNGEVSVLPSVGRCPPRKCYARTLLQRLSCAARMDNLKAVQRLFSMFPTGAAGIGLLMLRLSVGASIVLDVVPYLGITVHAWKIALSAILAALFLAGLFIPYLCALCCVIEFVGLAHGGNAHVLHMLALVTTTAALGIIGAGGYSWDAYVFGPRLVLTSKDD
jgi:hypothetical protein